VNGFDASIYALRRRPGRRRPYEVRWRAAGKTRSRSFSTRGLADSYRAELVRAARTGLEFDPATGEPAAWNQPQPPTVTWHDHAATYAAIRWPELAAHSRSSLADALATITPALICPDARKRPDPRLLRTVLYRHAYCLARPRPPGATPDTSWTGHGTRPCPSPTSPSLRCCAPHWTRSPCAWTAAALPRPPSPASTPSCTPPSPTQSRPDCSTPTRSTPPPGMSPAHPPRSARQS
jgi:hypothetical protein